MRFISNDKLITILYPLASYFKKDPRKFQNSPFFSLESLVLVFTIFQGVILILTPPEWKGEFIFVSALVIVGIVGRKWLNAFSNLGIVWASIGGLGLWIILQQFLDSRGSAVFGGKVSVLWLASFSGLFAISIMLIRANNWKVLERAFNAFELFVVLQLFASFFLGLGEIHSYRDGSVRAMGFLSDSISPILGFFVVKNALLYKPFRTWLSAFVLAIAGGKMALGVTLVAGMLILALGKRHAFAVLILLLAHVTAYVGIEVCFALELPRNKYYESKTIPSPASWPLKDNGGPSWEDRSDKENVLKRYPISRMGQLTLHLVEAGSNRFLSFIVAAEIIKQQPLIGVGFTRSNGYISYVRSHDLFGVNKYFTNPQLLWSNVRSIHNAWLRVTAELGIIGLALFLLFCVGMILVFLKVLAWGRSLPRVTDHALPIAAASWGLSFIVVNQTVGWMTLGHPQLLWLLIALGISARFSFLDNFSTKVSTGEG